MIQYSKTEEDKTKESLILSLVSVNYPFYSIKMGSVSNEGNEDYCLDYLKDCYFIDLTLHQN